LIICSPPCYPRCPCLSSVEKKLRFLMKTFQDFLHIMDFIGNQHFSAASKGFQRHQTMNKGLKFVDSNHRFQMRKFWSIVVTIFLEVLSVPGNINVMQNPHSSSSPNIVILRLCPEIPDQGASSANMFFGLLQRHS